MEEGTSEENPIDKAAKRPKIDEGNGAAGPTADGAPEENSLSSNNTDAENVSTMTTTDSTFFSNGVEMEASTSSSKTTEPETSSLRTGTSTTTEIESDKNDGSRSSSSSDSNEAFMRVQNRRNRNYRIKSTDDEAEPASDMERTLQQEIDERMANRQFDNMFFNFERSQNSDSDLEDFCRAEPDHPVFQKTKPKHNWFVVPDLMKREMGSSSKFNAPQLFYQRCYGSLRTVQRLELLHKLKQHAGCVNSLNFSPDGTLLASGSDDLKVCLWDWSRGKCLLNYSSQHINNVFQTRFLHLSGDPHIVTSSRDGQVRIAQVSNEGGVRSNRKLGEHRGPCHKIAVSADQPHMILSAGEDGLVLRHDVREKKPSKLVTVRYLGREIALYSVNTHPLKTHEFVVCGRLETVQVYDQRKCNRPLRTFNPMSQYSKLHVTCAVYNHDGSEILASYNDGDIFLFEEDGPEGHFIHRYEGHRNSATIKGVNFFGPKSEFVVSGSDCGHVYFWDKNLEAIVQWLLADYNGVVNCLEPHPQIPYICTSGLDWDIKVWSPSFLKEPNMLGLYSIVKKNEILRNEVRMHNINNVSSVDGELWMLWSSTSSSNGSSSNESTADSHDSDESPQDCSPS